MSKYFNYKKYNYPNKKLTKKEMFMWLLTAIVFSIFFILYMIKGFIFNCVFEWPIRFDVKTCIIEQIDPAKYKAAEKAVNFIP